MDKQPFDSFRDHVKPAIRSKLEEFILLGYRDVSEEKVWNFLKNKKWRKTPELFVHEVVRDVLSLKVGDFMNYATVESFKKDNWFDSDEGKDLLKGLI
ncbi:competence protein ComN [Metabacillus litoralis]|uniref:Competence protein ComN n=1 Tax=Metabacillus litoralis TaxID=152268 RepID=A0A5C6W2W3_9BACI|nr:post-transcriptional regulator [Metabacillus litoralis]TXC90063.1 competence protein ComN [Metabacillus litoralis]